MISRFLPGRTDTQIKNRWTTSMKGRVNNFTAERTLPIIGPAIPGQLQSWLNMMENGGTRDPGVIDWMTIPPLRRTGV
jgi:hypothetical protein